MGKLLLIPAVALMMWGAQAPASSMAERIILSTPQMHAVVGGAGAATPGIPFPQNFVTSDFTNHKAKWNEPGNRCQHTCSTLGPTNVGFDIGSLIVQISGGATPRLEVYADGQGRAFTAGTFIGAVSGFDLFTATLTTKCKGGTNNGQQCNRNSQCTPGGGICSACNQDGVCNGDGVGPDDNLPCQKICKGATGTGSDLINGKFCTGNPDCGNGACVVAIETGAQTCYLLGRCGNGTTGGCTQDCDDNGASMTAVGTGPMHTAFVRVLNGSGGEITRDETVFRMVSANSADPVGICDGLPE